MISKPGEVIWGIVSNISWLFYSIMINNFIVLVSLGLSINSTYLSGPLNIL